MTTLWTWLRDGWRCQQYGITRAQLSDLRAHYTYTRDTHSTLQQLTAMSTKDYRLSLRCDRWLILDLYALLGRKTMGGQ